MRDANVLSMIDGLLGSVQRAVLWRLEERTNPDITVASSSNPLEVLKTFYGNKARYRVTYTVADVDYEYLMHQLPKAATFDDLMAVIVLSQGEPEAIAQYGMMMTDKEFTFHLLHAVYHQHLHGPGLPETIDGP